MQQRQIKFSHTGHSAIFGNFSAGDTLRCSADVAKHFVEEAQCAKYADVATQNDPVQTPAPAGTAGGKKAAKAPKTPKARKAQA